MPQESQETAGDPADLTQSEAMALQPLRQIDQTIGPYRIIERLAQGGMGVVYKAEQRAPIRRTVAIKVIKLGLDTTEIIARFESERQALARMDHPNIARVLDANTDERGRPYFVMEYVPGSPITRYADENRLSIEQRLELMLQVCDAIGHAHAKAIIHRDIKAANVLAFSTTQGPRAKVIDFGVAKALTSDRLTDHTFNTARGQAIGTYENMSPEQADGSPDIDTRTDVYAMGVLLYELLSGSKPFDRSDLAKSDAELRRIIREVDPAKPSTRLSQMNGSEGTTIAASRHMQIGALTRELRSELEWIPLMAMRKERDRRYASPLQLAEDIRNYLADRPLRAGPESMAYRTVKMLRRNRSPLLGTMGIVLLIIAGTVTYIRDIRDEQANTARALTDARQQRSLAEHQQAVSEARFIDVKELANDFMFKFDDALVNVAGTTPARKMLADTALRYLDRLSRDPATDSALSRELALSYQKVGDILGSPTGPNVGETDQALLSYNKSLEIRQKLATADPNNAVAQRDLEVSYERIGNIQAAKGQTESALASYGKMLEISRKRASVSPDSSAVQRDLAVGYIKIGRMQAAKGQVDDALESYRKNLDITRARAQAEPANTNAQRDLSVSYENIAGVLAAKGQIEDALVSYRSDLEISRKLADSDPGNAGAQRDLSVSYEHIGDMQTANGSGEDALASYAKSLQIRGKLARADPGNASAQRDWAVSFEKCGEAFAALGRSEQALAHFTKSLDLNQKLFHDDPGNAELKSSLVNGYANAAWCTLLLKRFDDSLAFSTQGLRVAPASLALELDQAHALLLSGKPEEARQIYLGHLGEKLPGIDKLWEQSVLEDFAELEKQGITCAGMGAIRSELNSTTKR